MKLYKEVAGVSPPKGMLPYSADWFISWRPNIHSSLFINIHRYLITYTDVRGIETVIKSYQLYLEHIAANQLERVLSLTRAWTLVRFIGGATAADRALHPMRRPLCGARPGTSFRSCLRAVQDALPRRQDQEEQGGEIQGRNSARRHATQRGLRASAVLSFPVDQDPGN